MVPRTVQVRTTSSDKFAVVGHPTPTTVTLQRAGIGGGPLAGSPKFDACAVCFATSNGERAGAVTMGRCSYCGFVHDEKQALAMDGVTSEAKARRVKDDDGEAEEA